MTGTARASSFADLFGSRLGPIRDAFATSVARSLPVTAASPGFVYTFDPESGAFERETTIAGQLYLERPDPVGKGRWNTSFNYQRVTLDAFDGKDIGSLSDVRPPIIDPHGALFTVPLLGLDLDTNEFTTAATYGVTDDLDVNVTLPVLESKFRLRLQLDSPSEVSVPCRRPQVCTFRNEAFGAGDTFLRGKYRFFSGDWVHAAAGLVLRFPTGNEDNFQGGGVFEVVPMLYASTRRVSVGSSAHLQPYVNAGVNVDTDDVGRSEGRWGLGADMGVGHWATLAIAALGRNQFQRAGPADAFQVDRCLERAGPTCMAEGHAPLFGLDNERADFYDLSIGWRVNIWRDVLVLYANAILPLNNDGLRADVIPLGGIEATF